MESCKRLKNMRIRRIVIFVAEILLLILTIIQLATIIDLRNTYKRVAEYKIEEVTDVQYVIVPMTLKNVEQDIIEEEQNNEVKEDVFLGNFKLTAYCSCYKHRPSSYTYQNRLQRHRRRYGL